MNKLFLIAPIAFVSLYLILVRMRACGNNKKVCLKRRLSLFAIHITVFFLLFTVVSRLRAEIFESSQIQEIVPHVAKDTLVIFDIDDTIARMPEDLGNDTWFCTEIKKHMDAGKNFDEAAEIVLPLFFLIHYFTQLNPVNPEIIQLIADLQQQGTATIALTSRSMPLVERTKKELNRLGVYFSVCSPCDHDLDLSVTHAGKYAGGIMFCASNNKAKMLYLFLEQIDYHPKKIIFIDDKQYHLEQVEKASKKRDVPFVGMRYSYLDATKKAFSQEAADEQLQRFKTRLGLAPVV